MNQFSPKRLVRLAALFLPLLLLLPSVAEAKPMVVPQASPNRVLDGAIILVANSGANDASCGSEQLPCQTLQFAINKAVDGDILHVAGGTYTYDAASDICTPNLGSTAVACVVNKQLTILGGYSTSNWAEPSPATNPTVIDGAGTTRGVWAVSTGPQTALTLHSFTIQHGLATGIGARPDIRDQTNGFGGGMFIEDAVVNLQDVTFFDNKALGSDTAIEFGGSAAGGGIAVKGTQGNAECKNHTTQLVMNNVSFVENQSVAGAGTARGGYAIGGGFFASNATLQGNGLRFEKNRALAGSTQGVGKTSDGQFGDGQGGALAAHLCSDVTLNNLVATENSSKGGAAPNGDAGGAYGGALYAEGAHLSVTDAVITNNLAEGGDGVNAGAKGTASALAQGGGILTFESDLVLDRATVRQNTARGGSGQSFRGSAGAGGVAVIDVDAQRSGTLRNSLIADNAVEMGGGTDNSAGGGGGGLWVQGMSVSASHLTVANNSLSDPALQGQAILVITFRAAGTLDLSYSVIANHTGLRSALYTQANNVINLNRNLFANNTQVSNNGDTGAGTTNGTDTSLFEGDAGFVSPGSPDYDYHLSDTSPALDQATGSSETVDRDGTNRTGAPDLGSYEVVQFVAPNDFIYLPLLAK